MRLTLRVLGIELLHLEIDSAECESAEPFDSGTTAAYPLGFAPSDDPVFRDTVPWD